MPHFRSRAVPWRWASLLLAVLAACLALPGAADAHGPVDPAASHWQARIDHVPAGLQARAVDGDLRLWLQVPPPLTVEVTDYNRAPYLRFSPAGVFVNRHSAMWFVNESPPVTPPLSLTAHTPPDWQRVSGGHSYLWQDGRMQALSRTVLPAGSDDAGRWSVPLRIDGRTAAVSGELLHHPDPSPVWFWPILVALACVLAGLRLRRAALDRRMGRGLAALALAGFALASAGHQLHGRPDVTTGQIVVLALELAFTAWGVLWVARDRHGWVSLFIVAGVALWQGISLAATLTDGYVLLATGTLLGRLSEIACLAAGAGLLPIVFVIAERAGVHRGRAPSAVSAGT